MTKKKLYKKTEKMLHKIMKLYYREDIRDTYRMRSSIVRHAMLDLLYEIEVKMKDEQEAKKEAI